MKKKILLLGLLSTMLLASCGSKDIDDVKDTTTVVDTTTNTATSTTTSAQDTTTDTATSTTTSTADTTTSTTTSIVTTTDDVVEKVYVKIYEDVSNTKLLKQVEYEKGHKFKNEELAEIVVSKPNHEFVKWVDGTGADFSCGSRGKTLNEDLYIYPIFNEIPVTLGTLLNYTPTISTLTGQDYIDTLSEDVKENMSTPGFVNGKITDFSQYKDTPAYVKVSTAEQLVTALKNAKEDYKTTYNADGTISQTLNSEGTVKVIEIENDIDLGYNHMTSTAKGTGIVDDFCRGKVTNGTVATMSNMWKEHGISQIKIEGTSNLLIYSKNGAKLTHGGFKLTSCTDIAIRNLEFDEMWQWEDANTLTPSFTVGDCDSFSWAYMKISNCGNVWIDHCKFGKAFDGMIDISSPDYTANAGVAFRAPYGANGECNIQVSNCDFHSGDDDPNGYIYKMMEEVEADYQKTVSTSSTYDEDYTCQYQYYKILRDQYNLTFDEILELEKAGYVSGGNTKLTLSKIKENYRR